ncbi:uncharacterized protein Adt_42859 [Abeliophyllum distichum]|uniref:Uncharacterized protein n=1 Tax=Abeliophyllum distichum TaxID=126358 RepID=A0ABD1PSV4_9LAMI
MEVTASAHENLESKDDIDLVMHCKFANFPTRTCSSSSIKDTPIDLDPITEDESINENKLSEGSGVHATDMLIDSSSGVASSGRSHELKSFNSDILKAPIVEEKLGVTSISRRGTMLKV